MKKHKNISFNDEYFNELKMKRTDEFFKNLQVKHLYHKNPSASKLEPIMSCGNSKNRVKWKDSSSNELLNYDSNFDKHHSKENLNFLPRKEVNSHHITLRKEIDENDYHRDLVSNDIDHNTRYRKYKLNSRGKDLARKNRESQNYNSQKITLINPSHNEKVQFSAKKDKDQVLKITFKDPKPKEGDKHLSQRIGTSQDQKRKKVIELAIRRKRIEADENSKGRDYLIVTLYSQRPKNAYI